jgi:hypothetical protein
VILKIVRKGFWQFVFIKKAINYGTFHINAIFYGFGMGSHLKGLKKNFKAPIRRQTKKN